MTTDTYEPPLWIVAYWRVREAFGDDFVKTEKGHNMVKDMTGALKDGFLVRLQRVHGFKELLVYSE